MIQEITYKDWELLLEWRNHPSVRTASISTSVINVEEHKAYIKHLVDREDRIGMFEALMCRVLSSLYTF